MSSRHGNTIFFESYHRLLDLNGPRHSNESQLISFHILARCHLFSNKEVLDITEFEIFHQKNLENKLNQKKYPRLDFRKQKFEFTFVGRVT